MAITSVGYGGTVTYPDYGKGVVTPGRYTFDGPTDFRPSRVTGGSDRTVRVAGGTAQGWGVRDTEDSASVDVQLGSISSGSRWDLVGLQRDWSAEASSLVVVSGGSSEAIPSRDTDPGVKDVQPIALARVQAGQQYVTDVIDLRCWAADGGLVAVHTRALDYLTFPGTRVSIGDTTYTRVLSPSGAASWDVKAPPTDTGWSESPITNAGFTGTRRYRRVGDQVWVQAAGSRTGGSLTNVDFRLFTFGSAETRPSATSYGTAFVGGQGQRAYVRTNGEVHVEPMTIGSGQTFQVFITWPVG